MSKDKENGKGRFWLGLGLIAGVGAVAAGSAYAWRKTSKRFQPQTEGELKLSVLHKPVEVLRDRWGVPHIYAENDRDLFCAQGFVHAQDRFWQMELNRRVSLGRLSEIFGKRALELDRFTHRIGLPRAAESDLAALDSPAADILDAYCAGVNAYIEAQPLPVEFSILRYKPEKWRPLDTLAYLKLFAWSLGTNFETELLRARLVQRLGPEVASKLEPVYPNSHPIIFPPGADYEGAADEILASYGRIFSPLFADGGGSNNWVVSGSRTASGFPLLANDPHLPLQIPSVWYEMHLCSPDFEAVGATMAGSPCVALGHNRDIAWGATASMVDVKDLYIEQFHPENPRLYLRADEWKEAEVLKIEIPIKGGKIHTEEVLETCHGPVVADLHVGNQNGSAGNSPNGGNYKLSLAWTGYSPTNVFEGFLALNRARSFDEFRASFSKWMVPSLNMVYADRNGNIGYQLVGHIPIRKNGGGTLPAQGWNEADDWKEFIPYDELPTIYNPPSGLIITANNKIVGDDYPHHLSSDFGSGYRALRIREVLEECSRITIDDCRRAQWDFGTILGRQFKEILVSRINLEELDELSAKALMEIEDWSCEATKESCGETIYQNTVQRLLENSLGELLGENLRAYIGYNDIGGLSLINSFVSRVVPHLLNMIARDDRTLLDFLKEKTDWDALLKKSFVEAVSDLARRFGPVPKRWKWGRLHGAVFEHPLGAAKALRPLFNRGPVAVGGDCDTPAQMTALPSGNAKGGFEVRGWAVSYRQIVDLGNFDRSLMIHTTGQSGSPFSKHYDDMIKAWADGKMHPMLFDRGEVDKNVEAKLILKP